MRARWCVPPCPSEATRCALPHSSRRSRCAGGSVRRAAGQCGAVQAAERGACVGRRAGGLGRTVAQADQQVRRAPDGVARTLQRNTETRAHRSHCSHRLPSPSEASSACIAACAATPCAGLGAASAAGFAATSAAMRACSSACSIPSGAATPVPTHTPAANPCSRAAAPLGTARAGRRATHAERHVSVGYAGERTRGARARTEEAEEAGGEASRRGGVLPVPRAALVLQVRLRAQKHRREGARLRVAAREDVRRGTARPCVEADAPGSLWLRCRARRG